jgi:hypothetical protein
MLRAAVSPVPVDRNSATNPTTAKKPRIAANARRRFASVLVTPAA